MPYSRFLTHDLLLEMMKSLSFDLVHHKESRKLVYYMFQLNEAVEKVCSCLHGMCSCAVG